MLKKFLSLSYPVGGIASISRISETWYRSYGLSQPVRRSAVIKISLACDLDRVLRSFTARPSLRQSIRL